MSYFLAMKISKKNRENERDKNESAKIRQKSRKKTLFFLRSKNTPENVKIVKIGSLRSKNK